MSPFYCLFIITSLKTHMYPPFACSVNSTIIHPSQTICRINARARTRIRARSPASRPIPTKSVFFPNPFFFSLNSNPAFCFSPTNTKSISPTNPPRTTTSRQRSGSSAQLFQSHTTGNRDLSIARVAMVGGRMGF